MSGAIDSSTHANSQVPKGGSTSNHIRRLNVYITHSAVVSEKPIRVPWEKKKQL